MSSRFPYLASTEVVKDSSVLMWDRSAIRHLIARHPRLLENALLVASDYVTWHLTSHIGLACYTARQRVAQVLITLARTIGQKAPGGIAVDITNEELANAANVTPFTVSRQISEWRRKGALVKRRGNVLLVLPERLFQLSL
jgi:CRP-like cAMP-binding protein